MGHPFLHPSSKSILERMAHPFVEENVKLSRQRQLIFVCGGGTGGKDDSLRKKFLIYAAKNLANYDIFLAESAANDIEHFDEPKFTNIAEFEDVLCGIADCIVIFPESPGSYAEVGYFSTRDLAKRKILVGNPLNHFSNGSFLNDGPIELINRESTFRPSIPIPGLKKPKFAEIKNRIKRKIPPKTSVKIPYQNYTDYSYKQRFFIILHIIWILWVCEIELLHYVMENLFKGYDENDGRILLAALLSCNYVRRAEGEEEYFMVSKRNPKYLDITKVDIATLRTVVRSHYGRYFPKYDQLASDVSQ